ncbi:hypothetical protein M9Y10_004065 [Tritrichomonas musculus]|uniref:LIM zinc-binding domain-containing protein n=1 Tax=Tritrichomonas musculus TaxID=1915356 RepID=A0ABR2JTY6_9EUKA
MSKESNQQSISSQISDIINSLQNVSQRFDRMIQQASKLRLCISCKQKIEANDYIEYLNKPYHKECVKCSVDNCTNNDLIEEKGKLICNYHFHKKKENPTPEENKADAIDKFKKIYGNNEGENPVGQKAASDLLPNTSLHVTKPPEEIDKVKLDEIVGKDGKVVDMEGVKNEDPYDSDFGKITSTIVKIAILSSIETHNEYLNELKSKLRSSTGQAVIGNLVNEPKINYPSKEDIEKAINKPSFNQFQSFKIEITEEEQKEIQRTIINRLKSEKGNEDFKFIIYNQQLYDELEAQLRRDLEDNPYELIVVAQTVITSKHYDEYNEIKCQIPPENIIECFFYHGSKLDNHSKIAQTHFLLPGKDDMKQVKTTDPGFYGQGIYSTDNVFYAALYGNENGSKLLTVNNSATIIGCRVIYNKDKVKDMYEPVNHFKELSHLGKKIDDDITDNFGAHCVLVGSSHHFLPIQKEDIYKNRIYANEFVIPNKFQFIPCYSFRIMRKDHYILWKYDNEANKRYSKFMKEIKEDMEVNVYAKDNIIDAATLIHKKKYAALKLITNTTEAEYLIKLARKIIRSNFVCLVYADEKDQNNHMKWISEMENVLFTKDPEDFKKFAALEMNIVPLLEFIDGLKRKYETDDYHFKINEKKLLYFPNCIKTGDIYYDKYYNYPKKTNENQDNQNQSNQNQDNLNQSNQNQDNLNQSNQNQDNEKKDNQNQDNEKKDNEKKDNEKKDNKIKYFIKSITSLFW